MAAVPGVVVTFLMACGTAVMAFGGRPCVALALFVIAVACAAVTRRTRSIMTDPE